MDMIEQIRDIWPEWTIDEQIGEGPFGKVFRAFCKKNGTLTYSAIKVITIPKDELAIRMLQMEGMDHNAISNYYSSVIENYINELQLLCEIKESDNILGIEAYEVVEQRDVFCWNIFIRQELLDNLETYLMRRGMLSENEVIQMGVELTDALDACAKKGIIHRDITPANIFITRNGHFKLSDFGLARNLERVSGMNPSEKSFPYMAPEVYLGKQYGPNADVYSLGIILYELMNNNCMPFLRDANQKNEYALSKEAFERRIRGEELPLPCNAGAGFSNVLLKACSYHSENRYESAARLKEALMRIQHAGASKKTSVSNDARIPEQDEVRRDKKTPFPKKALFIAAAAIVIAVLLIIKFLGAPGIKQKDVKTGSEKNASVSAEEINGENTGKEAGQSAASSLETEENDSSDIKKEQQSEEMKEEKAEVKEEKAEEKEEKTEENEVVPETEKSPYASIENQDDADVPQVDSNRHYAVHMSEISDQAWEEINQCTIEYIIKRETENPYVKINNYRHIGDIFMGRKAKCIGNGKDENYMNKLFNLYEVDMTFTKKEDGEVYQERFTSVYYRRFTDIIVEKDGSVTPQIEKSSDPVTYDKLVYNKNGTKSVLRHIKGLETLDHIKIYLYKKKNLKNYYIEYLEY